MYESLKNRIAALEEEEEVVEEEERRLGKRINASLVLCLFAVSPVSSFTLRAIAEEAQKHVRGLEENAVHVKYIELVRLHRRSPAPPQLGS
jgi:hypothetical protein